MTSQWRVDGGFMRGVLAFCMAVFLTACGTGHRETIAEKSERPAEEKILRKGGEWYWYCDWRQVSLEGWVKRKTGIFTGKAIEVVPKHPDFSQKNECWAYFDVEEWLQPVGPRRIWVDTVINERHKTYEDFSSLKYCPFEKGKNYLVAGAFYEPTDSKRFPDVVIGTDKGADVKRDCGPTVQLDNNFQHPTVSQIRAIIEKKATIHE